MNDGKEVLNGESNMVVKPGEIYNTDDEIDIGDDEGIISANDDHNLRRSRKTEEPNFSRSLYYN